MRYAHAANHDVEDDTESQDAEDSITTETVRGTPSPAMSNGKEAQAASESGITTNKKRWRWDHEKEDSLISCLVEYKTKKDFEGKDMESDLVKFYEDIRQMMAAMYPIDDFGPFEISLLDPGTDLESKLRSMRTISEEKKLIKIGYGRIKDKVKLIRQKFKKAVVDGTRSGSGKIITPNWDSLVQIWGACPSVTKVAGAIASHLDDSEKDEMSDDTESLSTVTEEENTSSSSHKETPEEKPSAYPKKRSLPEVSEMEAPPKKSKLVDNKRKKLEKPLSAHQRDQVMLKIAKEELDVKKRNAEIMEKSSQGMEKMLEAMTQSLTSLGQQLGGGLILLAQAMSSNQNNQNAYPAAYGQQQYNHYNQGRNQFMNGANNFTTMLNSPLMGDYEKNQEN